MKVASRLAAVALLVAAPLPALAHPKLVTAIPAAGATTSAVKTVSLTFNETLMAPLSGLEVVMTAMPGMAAHSPMKMSGVKVSVGPDGKSLVAALGRALPAGTYDVNWHIVGSDSHRVTGKLSFSVN